MLAIALAWLGLRTQLWAQQGRVYGVVQDSEGQPLAYATVALYRSGDSVQRAGGLSDSVGAFVLPRLEADDYRLVLRFLGYESLDSSFVLPRNTSLDLGILRLRPGQLLLDEIEISGRRSQTYHEVDRQVYDATQFRQAQGGSALDVVRNLPSVSVDGQGQVSVRGTTGFIVMIDGKQVQTDAATLLQQLPANAIANVEILTAPSARYDPDGKAGIINIETRRGATDGLYVLVNGLWGAPSIENNDNPGATRRYGGDLTVNLRTGKWDLAAGIDYRRNDLSGRRVGYVNTYLDEVLTELPSAGERSFDRYTYSGRLAATFVPDTRQRVGVNFYAGKRDEYRTADILYDFQQRSHIPTDEFLGTAAYWERYQERGQVFDGGMRLDSLTFYNENLRVRRGDFLLGSVDYSLRLPDDATLQLSALYERTLLGGPTDNSSLAWPDIADTLQTQYDTNDNPLDGVRLKVDYSRKLGAATWESGYQYRYLYHPGDFLYLDRDLENDRWITNPLLSNRIELRRQIHAVYTQVSGTWQKLQYSAGLRIRVYGPPGEPAPARYNLPLPHLATFSQLQPPV
ncbi:MAG: hypothetical protein OHK0039_00600 [Bacteroidia bacterium]